MQNTKIWCPEKLKKLQEISNKIKYFYAERVVAVYGTTVVCLFGRFLTEIVVLLLRTPEMAFQIL